ncbi:MAG: shikimate dehydrogenase [Clostridiaceae bacterium]|nr:shikimate dehydrogenase [Clostridiaceae bacterium]
MRLDMRVNSKTKLTGLIGNPLGHTVSPFLQNSLFSSMGINGIYIPLCVPDGRLRDAVKGLEAFGFMGFNVTIPYKRAVMECLDEISEEAELLGAVNTVKITEDSLTGKFRLWGHNTDGDGFIRAFHEQAGTSFADKKVCMLGAGGTARALTIKVALEGAESICIINRTESKAQELAEKVKQIIKSKAETATESRNEAAAECVNEPDTKLANGPTDEQFSEPAIESINKPAVTIAPEYLRSEEITAAAFGSTQSLRALEQCDIIINATSVGMYPDIKSSPLEESFPFRPNQIIYDVIYNPVETKLMSLARSKGCIAINGAGMLFYQGVKAFEVWMDKVVPKKILNDLSNAFIKYLES